MHKSSNSQVINDNSDMDKTFGAKYTTRLRNTTKSN